MLLYVIMVGFFVYGGIHMQAAKAEISSIAVASKRDPRFRKNNMRAELIDSPIYDDELMQRLYDGIIQNIKVEMDKQGLTIRGLSEISGVHFSHLSNMFNGKSKIGLDSLIRIAVALGKNPSELFPYDHNKRKTCGERFDEITKDLDVPSVNFLIEECILYCKEIRRLKRQYNNT